MLVHICCSVDSYYYLKRLREEFPEEPLRGYFDNPNIHPEAEWRLRLEESRRSCDYFGLPFEASDYAPEAWFEKVRGLEEAPEKGARCQVCFDHRLENACRRAVELGETKITTTLLMSPLKEMGQLGQSAARMQERYGVEFIILDYRRGGGTQAQQAMAEEMGTYRQDYCGCLFALSAQRERQKRPVTELSSPLTGQFPFGAIERRQLFFAQTHTQKPRRRRMLAWRLLHGLVRLDGEVRESYIFAYSQSPHRHIKATLEGRAGDLWLLSKSEACLMELADYRRQTGRADKSIAALCKNPPSLEEEIALRTHLLGSPFDLSVIVILEGLQVGMRVEIELESWLGEEMEWCYRN